MSLFDSASLIVTPNGVKEDKLYSIKPTDGSGDLVVTRATTATRVNSDGLIEQVPYNLLQRSQEFENAYWTKATATISANATTAPNGTLTADKLIGNNLSTASNVNVAIVVSQGVNYNFSIYAKASGADWIQLIATGTTIASPARLWVNVSTGALGTNNGGFLNVNVSNEGNGWYRISGYFTTTSTTTTLYYAPATADNINGYNGNGTDGLFLWGAQLVSGTSAKEYFPTTDRLDVPRLDYTNSSCPSILVEPQRTNVLTYSEDFTNASWTKVNCSISSNSTISPDGTTTADLLTSDNIGSFGRIQKTLSSSGTITFSLFVKQNTANLVTLYLTGTGIGAELGVNLIYDFNFTTNALVKNASSSSTATSTQVENFDNNWKRISVTVSSTTITDVRVYSNWSTINNFSTYIWGAQLEAGSYATSYIPTIASSVTRNADVISKTGISSLIGQTEGILFAELSFSEKTSASVISINDSTTNNIVFFSYSSITNSIRAIVKSSNVSQCDLRGSDININQYYKIALKYKLNDFALFVNGTKVAFDTSGTIPSGLNKFEFSEGLFNALKGNVKSVQLYKTALTDQECINLTTI